MAPFPVEAGPPPPDWLDGGVDRDVVVFCRVGLGRNLGDALFPGRASASELGEVRARLLAAIDDRLKPARRFLFEDLDAAGAAALRERRWCGRPDPFDPARAVVLDDDGIVYSLNDTDHLRSIAFVSGADFASAFEGLKAKDQELDAALDWACTPEQGFLTARLDEAGAALNLTALAFIPGIIGGGMFERVSRGLVESGVQVRYGGQAPAEDAAETVPPPEPGIAPLVELSVRAPRGAPEETVLESFRLTLSRLVSGERRTRERYLAAHRDALENAAYRAAALLIASRGLSEAEARRLAADLRTGQVYGVGPRVAAARKADSGTDPYAPADRFTLQLGPGQLRLRARSLGRTENDGELDKLRAELARGVFPRYDIEGGSDCLKD